jgi:hypothetical protein
VGSSASSLCTFLPTCVPFGRLRSGFPFRSHGDGFPEFTRFFTHSFPWGLQCGVHVSVTVRAKEFALVQFFSDFFPAVRVPLARDTEIFPSRC